MNTTSMNMAGSNGPTGGGDSGSHPEPAGTKCCVCLEEVDYRGTALVQCGRCKIDVHVKCYGVTVPTDGSTWLCEACKYMDAPPVPGDAPKIQPHCVVCPSEGGALRRTNQAGIWCHVLCMNWIPELSHSLSGEMNEVLDISVLDRSRQSLKCHICGLKGGCIQCISGRCAKPFHVICAMRVPSDTVFTGYNNENQQVYHCKTHLSDIATFKYEMIDTTWKKSPLMVKFLESTPPVKNKCRVCGSKVPPHYLGRHEVLCLVGWLAKEESKARRKQMEELGLTPVAIDYSQGHAGKSSGRNETTLGKNRKNGPPMRPCPQCGEHVRETLMMGHLKNDCKKTRHSAKRAKNPVALNRQHSNHHPETVDLTQDAPASAALDLSDVLFATWPGQAAGSLLDSTNFWRILNNNFFSTKILLKKRMEPLCRNLCGARLEDMGDFSKKTSPHASILCSDTVLFGREDNAAETLSMTSIVHRCDFMMRGSRMRCVDDLFAKPVIQLNHTDRHVSEHGAPNGKEQGVLGEGLIARDITVQFRNTEGDCMSCKFAIRANESGASHDAVDVWSRYHPDAVSTIVGGGLENVKTSLKAHDKLWVSLQEMEAAIASSGGGEKDELTPELSLLVEQLREQMRQNRYRVRSLCRRTQAQDYGEEAKARERVVVETYFKEFALWKALCKSLLIGYREFWKPTPVVEGAETSVEKEIKGENGDDEEPVDDGTCVVCFDGQSPESNPIIFCDRCDLAVHQRCYGIPHVPNNEFYCDRCRLEDDGRDPATEVYCQLCPLRDGAFKRTVDGKWVHVVCALWCPGVWIGNLQTLSEIKLVDSAHRTRFVDTISEVKTLVDPQSHDALAASRAANKRSIDHGSLCRYCRVACGRTIQCCHPECTESLHPLCAWFEGYPMTVKLDAVNGYIYSGGGSGLSFKMFCRKHLPDDYTQELRVAQAKNRRRFRIDAFFMSQSKLQTVPLRATPIGARASHVSVVDTDNSSMDEWTDRELCAACFDYASPVPNDAEDCNQLSRRQLMMRCQYCNIFIHAACCLSEIDEVSDLFRSNWICERCTLVDQAKKTSASGCVVCDRASDYMMPCVGGGAIAISTALAPGTGSSALIPGKSITHVSGSTLAQATDVQSAGSASERWIHVLCAKMTKAKIFKRHHMLCAAQPQLSAESHGRCDICQTRGRNLANCGNCSKRFHPTCAARKKFYVSRSNKSDWKFYCPTHPPVDVAYDEKRQAWFTGEILAHLHELRHILERGRMIVEMARQRDRQKKRMLNLCSVKKMELSMEMILKKRPTPLMKDVFEQYTGEVMEDVAKRQTAAPSRVAKAKNRSRVDDDEEDGETDVRRSSRRSSNSDDKNSIPDGDFDETPRKRRRLDGEYTDLKSSRRSSRRGADAEVEPEDTFISPTSGRPLRGSSRVRLPVAVEQTVTVDGRSRRNRALNLTPEDFDYNTLSDALLRVTRDSDFDEVVADAYPELV